MNCNGKVYPRSRAILKEEDKEGTVNESSIACAT